jgi:hypothetical protein
MSKWLLTQFLNGGESSMSWTTKNLMLNEGHRVIFVSFRYCTSTGKLTYAASVFRRRPVLSSDDAGNLYLPVGWSDRTMVDAIFHKSVVMLGDEGLTPYYEIVEDDVSNHIHTTSERYKIRPVRLLTDPGLSYEDVIKTIRWEMCHGHGCKGVRNCISDTDSETSLMSSDSLPKMSDRLSHVKTVHHLRWMDDTRDILIAAKGLDTGEIAYAAAVNLRSNPDNRMSEEMVTAHWQTADKRLERCPVVYQLSDENMEFVHQLKRTAVHREDVTILLVDHIFKRRGGRLNIKNME